DLAHIRFVELTARVHPIERCRLQHALPAPDVVAHFLLLVVPVTDVDHRAAARRADRELRQLRLDLGDALLGVMLAKAQGREVFLVLLLRGPGLGPLVLELLLREPEVEPGELQLQRARQIFRALRLQLGLARLAGRLRDAQLLVAAREPGVRQSLADLRRHGGPLVLLLLQLARQLGGVEPERRLTLLDRQPLRRHARDLELADAGHQRRAERVGVEGLELSRHLDAEGEVAALDRDPVRGRVCARAAERPERAEGRGPPAARALHEPLPAATPSGVPSATEGTLPGRVRNAQLCAPHASRSTSTLPCSSCRRAGTALRSKLVRGAIRLACARWLVTSTRTDMPGRMRSRSM